MKGIKFGNYHSYNDFSLILSQKTIGTPSLKTESVDIPGGDGVLDLTEFFGDVKYNNRPLSFDFSTKVYQDQFMELFSAIQNALHGQKKQIIIDEDAEWYYTGRITVSEWKADKNIGKLTIDCDCEPYKLKIEETVVSKAVSGSMDITLSNSRKRVVPTIATDAEMTISFGTYSGTFSAGTFRIPELELLEGNNIVTVTGTGNITFRYREGAL
jgi:phage-related protein